MSEIPENVIEAGIEAWAEYTDEHGRDTFTGQGLVTAILRKAEEVWPHDVPQRDPHSTTSSSTPFGNERHAPYYRSSGRRFGFGPMDVSA